MSDPSGQHFEKVSKSAFEQKSVKNNSGFDLQHKHYSQIYSNHLFDSIIRQFTKIPIEFGDENTIFFTLVDHI